MLGPSCRSAHSSRRWRRRGFAVAPRAARLSRRPSRRRNVRMRATAAASQRPPHRRWRTPRRRSSAARQCRARRPAPGAARRCTAAWTTISTPAWRRRCTLVFLLQFQCSLGDRMWGHSCGLTALSVSKGAPACCTNYCLAQLLSAFKSTVRVCNRGCRPPARYGPPWRRRRR